MVAKDSAVADDVIMMLIIIAMNKNELKYLNKKEEYTILWIY